MRKLAIIASAAAVALAAFTGCSNNAADSAAKANGGNDSVSVTTNTELSGEHDTPMAAYIRYVDTQKILSSYTLAVEVAKADSTAQIKLAAYQNELAAGLQTRQQKIQDKLERNGYLSEQSYKADVAALQKAQEDAENKFAQRQYDYAADIMAKRQQLNDSVKSVVTYISVKYNLDAIIDKTAGLYFNPALDITEEVLDELNSRYSGKK